MVLFTANQDFGLDLEARPLLSQADIKTKTKTSVAKSKVKTKTFTKQTWAVLIFKTMVSRQQDWWNDIVEWVIIKFAGDKWIS